MFENFSNYIVNKETTEKNNFIWNMLGSGIYSASSMILSLAVIKIVGASEGGVFAIALTLSQMLVYIAYFEMRTFQVTDVRDEFKFSEYHSGKLITCLLMIIVCSLYVWVKRYDSNKVIVILLVCFSRLVDGYADVYEAHFQKIGRLDLAGKSLAYRTSLFVVALIVGLLVSGKLIYSLIFADVVAIIGLWIFDINIMNVLGKIAISKCGENIKKILINCFPLFIGVFCWTYILSASRIAIDGNLASKYQSYYQIIFMPVSVINLFAGFVLRPVLPKLADEYCNGLYKAFKKNICNVMLGIMTITFVCIIGAYILGIPVLSILSGCDLHDYRFILTFLIFSGGINAIAFTLYYVLTIMRCMKSVLIDYILAAVLAAVISVPMVRIHAIAGAAFSFFITVSVLSILFAVSILKKIYLIKKGRKGY